MRRNRLSNSNLSLLPCFLFAICISVQGSISAAQESANPPIKISHPEVPRIPANELKNLLNKKADIVLVDVNSKDSFDTYHIPSAINIPYASYKGTAKRDALLAKLPKNKLIVLYCFCEEGADSSETALLLRRMDYRGDRVKVLEGGLIKWDEKGYPVFKQDVPE
jgi:rhodanese-related sulfurtransferase